MKIMSVVGARPNFMKIASIINAICVHNKLTQNSKLKIQHLLVHTGQHYDDSMSEAFFQDLALPVPDIFLGVGSASHAVQTAEIMKRLEPVLLEHRPDIVVLVGDVNSTVACALVASKIEYPTSNSGLRTPNLKKRPLIAHVEAGLRSFDRTMPEEINRILTDALSNFLFVSEPSGLNNLKNEGFKNFLDEEAISKNNHPLSLTRCGSLPLVAFVGNTMIDTLLLHVEKARILTTLCSVGIPDKKLYSGYAILTLHRPSNVDTLEALGSFIECLKKIAEKIPIVFPVHPRTKASFDRLGIYSHFSRGKGIYLIEPLGYLKFLNLLLSAALVLTDSGGIQEETTFLGIPCITLRNNTERPITIDSGTNHLVGMNLDNIFRIVDNILDGQWKRGKIPPLWDGNAGKRIVDILIRYP